MTGPSAPRWVWVTRAEPGASATASRLLELGFAPIVAPMIRTVDLDAVAPAASTYDALAFTSASAVRRFARMSPSRDQAVFSVGDATAEAVRAQGWTNAISADADLIGLGALLSREAKGLRILHPCAEVPAGDLAAFAKDIAVTALPVYATIPERTWPERVRDAVLRSDGAVLLHSPSAAQAVAACPEASQFASRLTAFVLSDACAAPITTLSLREIVVAPFPREAALLKVVSETLWR